MSWIVFVLFGVALAIYWVTRDDPAEPADRASTADAEPQALTAEVDGDGKPREVSVSGLLERLALMENEVDSAGCRNARDAAELAPFKKAVAVLTDPRVDVGELRQLISRSPGTIACFALAAMAKRADRNEAADKVIGDFADLGGWQMHFALELFKAADPRPAVGAHMVQARDWWAEDGFVIELLRDYLAERVRLGDAVTWGDALSRIGATDVPRIRLVIERLNNPAAEPLLAELDTVTRGYVDRAFLKSFGRFWANDAAETLVEPAAWRDDLDDTSASVKVEPVRSMLVRGEARSGKSSLLRLAAQRIAADGWQVFEASGADLMAGQQWFGQLEARIQKAIEELSAGKKLIWYVPDIMQFAMSGTHQGQAASILDQILPAVTSGRLVIWTEASPAATTRLLRIRPTLRGLFDLVRLEQLDAEEAHEVATALGAKLASRHGVTVEDGAVETALASAAQYMSVESFPGTAFDLLRLTVARVAKTAGAKRVEAGDVIGTLAQLSGLPATILDARERVDLAAVRTFFTDRVMGQDEAVASIVERIAMLKAGLNDPGKPIGVFLFAGPTGTGKTELAKTLAEFLFGAQDRMVRLDMSEFQTAESTFKILGSGDASGGSESLITLVRKQPFSVVLLDEFEKAHANVWDLFLQVFDDGRLTDQMGQVADFRHCFIILTTNLGATDHRGAGIGFSRTAGSYTGDEVLRAVSQTFRPEFQNRLDKVIVFRPLTRDLMRGILKKELARILNRRGLKDREWAIEWEASALEFLLEKGFSPEMGARPLKRAIDQYLVAPLAATIVERRFPEGDQFVFVRSDGRAIQAEFVDPDDDVGDGGVEAPIVRAARNGEPVALPEVILAPIGSDEEVDALDARLAEVEAQLAAPSWDEEKLRLAARMSEEGFWTSATRYETLARLALMDRVEAATQTATGLRARIKRGRDGKSSRELTGRLALQLLLVGEGLADVAEHAPVEAAVMIEPTLERADEHAEALAWAAEVAGMYRAWAGRRNMQLAELPSDGAPGRTVLVVTGFGAHRALSRETGLHVLERSDEDDGRQRSTARVRVVVPPIETLGPAKLRRALSELFEQEAKAATVVRRYRGEPSPLVRDLAGGWRSGRYDAVLRGDFDLIAATST